MKYIRFMEGKEESFKIFSGNLKHSDEAERIERKDIISAAMIYFSFDSNNPEWYISGESLSLGIGSRADDTAFFREQFKQ